MYSDYPFKSHYHDLSGLRMHYVDEGPAASGAADAGPLYLEPIVCVHGNPSWSYYFRSVIASLSQTHRCIAMDHIGMGLSDKPADDLYNYTLSQRVDDLENLLDKLGFKQPITLVVHDWGGMIGMAYAVRHPDRIARLVVLNTAAFHLPGTKKIPWQLKLARMPGIGALLVRGFNGFSRGAVRDCVTSKPMTAEIKRAYLGPYDSWANRIAVHRFVQDIPLRAGDRAFDLITQVENGLQRFADTPMLICWGMRDFVFDVHFLDEWIKRFPNAQVHRFEDAGHFILEDAGERIIPLIKKFLEVS